MRWSIAIVALCAAGCYESHTREGGAEPPADAGTRRCAGDRPVCVAPRRGCEPWRVVDTLCGDDLTWRCPAGSQPHARADAESCFPFEPSFERLGAIGPEIPVGESCLMLANGEVSTVGVPFESLGVDMAGALPFGACPSATREARPLLDRSALPDDVVVDVMDTVVIDGAAWSLVRLFVLDPEGGFGVTGLGSEWVRHAADGTFAPTLALEWEDPHYRSAVVRDGWVWVFVALGEPGLLGPARLERARAGAHTDRAAYEPVGPEALFDVGPQFAVTEHPSGVLVLTTIEGFGSHVLVQTAPAPEGPWSPPRVVADCALPEDDPMAFCDGARLVPSRLDPTVPDELVVSYRVGTLTPGWETSPPERYWPRIARTALPR